MSGGTWRGRPLMLICGLLCACDYHLNFIELEESRSDAATQTTAGRDAPSGPDREVRAGAGGNGSSPPRDMDAGLDASTPRSGGDAAPPPAVVAGAGASGTSAADAGVAAEASVDEPDSGDDTDGGVDAIDPCSNGTFRCRTIPVDVLGDFAPLSGATLTAVLEGHRFQATSVDGRMDITLPIDRDMWTETVATGYMTTRIPIRVTFPEYVGHVELFTLARLNTSFGAVAQSQDEGHGVVMVYFLPNIAGGSIEIGVPTDPPVVMDQANQLRLSDTLVPGGTGHLYLLNVPPGPLRPMPAAPGFRCATAGNSLEHVMPPREVMFLLVECIPAAP